MTVESQDDIDALTRVGQVVATREALLAVRERMSRVAGLTGCLTVVPM